MTDPTERLVKENEALRLELSQLRQTVAALQETESKWRQLAQTAPDIIASLDREGVILLINHPAAGAKTVAELIGTSAYDWVPPKQHDELRKALAYVFHTGERTQYEMSARGPDGILRWYSSHFGPVTVGGRVIAVTVVSPDITARKNAEEELKLALAELARSNTELEQFAYIASHDLQEPLRKVQAFGDLLLAACGPALTAEGCDYLRRMQNAAHRMQGLIDDLLTFSRVTTQAKPFVAVDLSQVAQEVVSDLEARLRETEGAVEIGDLPVIDADPTQMRQLLQNLIVNALKYRRPGEPPRVQVQSGVLSEVHENPGAAARCEIRVRDNGIGFEEKYLDRIFIPFQRLHGRSENEGAGMGLAICQRIVERHGGTITARSAPGHGATFIVRLPPRQPKGEAHHG